MQQVSRRYVSAFEVWDQIKWFYPQDLVPGTFAYVHALWEPHPQLLAEISNRSFATLIMVPDPPLDMAMGKWSPMPLAYQGIHDLQMEMCCGLLRCARPIFDHPDSDKVTLTVLDTEWTVPAKIPGLVAVDFTKI